MVLPTHYLILTSKILFHYDFVAERTDNINCGIPIVNIIQIK